VLCLLALVASLALLSGCVIEGEPLRKPPRDAPPQPSGLVADTLIVAPESMVMDSNHNGYGDTVRLFTYLFAARSNYAPSLRQEGSFVFGLYPTGTALEADSEPIAEWTFTAEQARGHLRRHEVGPYYSFDLSLLDVGASDRFPTVGVDLLGEFITTDGQRIRSKDISSVLLGRAGG
jgi:hypothetical protein